MSKGKSQRKTTMCAVRIPDASAGPASRSEIAPSHPSVQPPWPEFSSFHPQPLCFHILIDSASVNPFGSHTSKKSHIYIKTMGFKPFRDTYLQSAFSQTLLNHILNKKGDGGVPPSSRAGGLAGLDGGKRMAKNAADGGLGHTREVFGEETFIGEFGDGPAPFDPQAPARKRLTGAHADNLLDRDHQQRMERVVERPDTFGADEQADFQRPAAELFVAPALDHHERSEFAGALVHAGIGARGSKERSDEKQDQAYDGRDPSGSPTQRRNHKRGSKQSEGHANGEPHLWFSAQGHEFSNQADEGKQHPERRAADFGKRASGTRDDRFFGHCFRRRAPTVRKRLGCTIIFHSSALLHRATVRRVLKWKRKESGDGMTGLSRRRQRVHGKVL